MAGREGTEISLSPLPLSPGVKELRVSPGGGPQPETGKIDHSPPLLTHRSSSGVLLPKSPASGLWPLASSLGWGLLCAADPWRKGLSPLALALLLPISGPSTCPGPPKDLGWNLCAQGA